MSDDTFCTSYVLLISQSPSYSDDITQHTLQFILTVQVTDHLNVYGKVMPALLIRMSDHRNDVRVTQSLCGAISIFRCHRKTNRPTGGCCCVWFVLYTRKAINMPCSPTLSFCLSQKHDQYWSSLMDVQLSVRWHLFQTLWPVTVFNLSECTICNQSFSSPLN